MFICGETLLAHSARPRKIPERIALVRENCSVYKLPGFYSRTRRHMWVEFVVGSLLCSERFFTGYSSFPLSSKTNISNLKFQFDLDYCQALYHEPLARVIALALPVFDIKFTFTFTFYVLEPSVR